MSNGKAQNHIQNQGESTYQPLEVLLQQSDVPAHSKRKPSGLMNRKGMPQKYNPLQIIQDEEYILSQTPQKQKHLGHLT